MTYLQLIARVAKKSGYPEPLVRKVLGATLEVVRVAILQREVIQFRGLFKITPDDRPKVVRSSADGSKTRVGRLMLRIKPVRAFRAELTRWSKETPMEKFGVATNDEAFKQAAAGGRPCPECGGHDITHRGDVPFCAKCGTRPWETSSRAGEETGGRPHTGKSTY